MGIDVMIVGAAEDIASRPSDELYYWLDALFEDYEIRYGYVVLEQGHVARLRTQFAEDDVGAMLLKKIDAMSERGAQPPYIIELMIGA